MDAYGKAVVFDCDGTLTTKEIRSLMYCVDSGTLSEQARERGMAMRRRYLPLAQAGTMTAAEEADWLRGTLQLYIDDGLTMDRIRASLAGVPLRPGAAECLRLLHAHGIPVAVVSYGVRAFVEAFLEANGIGRCVNDIYSAVLEPAGPDGRFSSYRPDSFVFPSNKGLWSRRFAWAQRVPKENLFAVGDSLGDRRLGFRKERRLGIAKDAAEAALLAPHMGRVVISDSFEPVTAWLKEELHLA